MTTDEKLDAIREEIAALQESVTTLLLIAVDAFEESTKSAEILEDVHRQAVSKRRPS